MNKKPRTLAISITLALTVALTGCSQVDPAKDGVVRVTTSTAVWGAIVDEIANGAVQVTSIVNKPTQDPHEFEASARDQLAVSKADLAIYVGNGYDNFMKQLTGASHLPDSRVLQLDPKNTTVQNSDGYSVDDPHVWYDLKLVSGYAVRIAERIRTLIRAETPTAEVAAALAMVDAGLAKLQGEIKAELAAAFIKGGAKPLNLIQTESVGFRMLNPFVKDLTPAGLRQASLNGTDISVATMRQLQVTFASVRNQKAGAVWVLSLNAQQSTPQIEEIRAWAKSAEVPIITFSENMPGGGTFMGWMQQNRRLVMTLYTLPIVF